MVPTRRFFAPAPWRGVQETPQAQQKVVSFSGDFMGGGVALVLHKARRRVPVAEDYALDDEP
jgi:hypothetical protein